MNSLFSYLFTEFERVIFGGVRDYFGEVSGGKIEENYLEKIRKNPENPIRYYKIPFKFEKFTFLGVPEVSRTFPAGSGDEISCRI